MSENTDIPVMRARQEEIDGIVAMLCSASEMLDHEPNIIRRLKSVKNAYRDYKMVISKLDQLTEKMKLTLPPEKRRTLDALIPDITYHIAYHKRAGRRDDPVSGIFTKDLDLLIAVCHDTVCKLCDGNCNRCDLGKAFDRMLGTNRAKDESYTYIDMENGFDVLGIKHGG